ncbi:sugar ABC transporter ATP-binding protein [Ruminococcaceae bacterium OttesenSCG-928-D13]|nr:sugar ABC transporter ATP-binding protein [Ruminococcaceae bacterium OttesenSCG-928-D13]
MASDYLLEMHDITKIFPGVRALDKVSFKLGHGEAHALIGENGAGKSTLMKVALGSYQPDTGEMRLKGEAFAPKSPADALGRGISMIHQELTLVPEMTVAENIWIGRENNFKRAGLISPARRTKATRQLLDQLGIELDPDTVVSKLSVAHMQLVEIARAVSYDSDVIIMDEPTSALTNREIDKLYEIVNDLIAHGKSVIFISHKLEELFTICSKITVLRDGQFVATEDTANVTQDELIRMMVGRKLENLYPKEEAEIGEVIFEVRNLSRPGYFEDVSFSVKRGEVLGFCGLMGAGRTEIMQSIFGIDRAVSGEILVNGKPVKIKNTKQAIKSKMAMVTEDRLRRGAIHKLSVKTNISLAYLDAITHFEFIDQKQEIEDCQRMVDTMGIKVASINQEIGSLSGGNQQKAIIGKWMLTQPEILILDEPTRGIDVGSKSEIYRLINSLAQSGKAIIVVSSELPEIMGICDRILVVRNGRIAAESPRAEFNQENLMKHAFGV